LGVSLCAVALSACGASSSRGDASLGTGRAVTPSVASSLDSSSLRDVNWGDAVYPGRACFSAGSIKLTHGTALIPDERRGHPVVPSSNGPRYRQLALTDLYAYGDLEREGTTDAVIGLWCNNNGGTADGALLYSLAVFAGTQSDPKAIGLVTPQVQERGQLPTLLTVMSIEPGHLVVRESWYRPHDGTCCPSGVALTAWTVRNGHLSPGKPVIRK
jgi:hypothetical protein